MERYSRLHKEYNARAGKMILENNSSLVIQGYLGDKADIFSMQSVSLISIQIL